MGTLSPNPCQGIIPLDPSRNRPKAGDFGEVPGGIVPGGFLGTGSHALNAAFIFHLFLKLSARPHQDAAFINRKDFGLDILGIKGTFVLNWMAKMFKVNGNDIFEDNIYSWYSWSADVIQSADDARKALRSLNLMGKTIISIKTVGLDYNASHYEFLSPEEDIFGEEPDFYPRSLELDEPLIIGFSDGDRLEIDFSEGSSIRISKNCLPVNIRSGVHPKTNGFDAAELFSCCLGESIADIKVQETSVLPDFTGSYGIALAGDITDYIEAVFIVLGNGVRLKFEAWYDYGEVTLVNEAGLALDIGREELEQLLRRQGWQPAPVLRLPCPLPD